MQHKAPPIGTVLLGDAPLVGCSGPRRRWDPCFGSWETLSAPHEQIKNNERGGQFNISKPTNMNMVAGGEDTGGVRRCQGARWEGLGEAEGLEVDPILG